VTHADIASPTALALFAHGSWSTSVTSAIHCQALCRYMLAATLARAGKFAGALEQLKLVQPVWEAHAQASTDAQDEVTRRLQPLRLQLYQLMLHLGQHNEALAHAQTCLQAASAEQGDASSSAAHWRLKVAQAHGKLCEHETALSHLRILLSRDLRARGQQDTSIAHLHTLIAEQLSKLGKRDEAVMAWRRALFVLESQKEAPDGEVDNLRRLLVHSLQLQGV
jgi:tetratricopeptide (TPR) repeat protein